MSQRESLPDQSVSGFRIVMTARQADAVAALARLYMSTEQVDVVKLPQSHGWIGVEKHGWRWAIDRMGRVAADGQISDTSDEERQSNG